jgi:hypothetical protein
MIMPLPAAAIELANILDLVHSIPPSHQSTRLIS